ncbi:hypothetical protein COCON_G00005590 [Conger conger]|uniref:Uncharacterized protein n=1 Tax=Conger conger TaxID=82655 RepID=A0A9Q1E1I4_CONCO|nr:hypothetical protein COCON_G00005590 [Conger conger]
MKFTVIPAASLFLALATGAIDPNFQPCMPSARTDAYNTFLHRHVHSVPPERDEMDAWTAFLKNNNFCNRPVQSFFPYDDMRRVVDVCARTGGKIHLRNLCISKGNFSFITLTVQNETCAIKRIERESKHIILACEEIKNTCQPVHYQKNPENYAPKDSAPDCPGAASHSAIRAAKTLVFLLVFLCPALL